MSMQALSTTDFTFWFSALAGTLIFLPKLLLMFLGDIGEGLLSEEMEDLGDQPHHQSDTAFKVFSLHSLSGFFMMFGWGGLAASQQFDLGPALSVLVALVSGLLMLWLTAGIFRLAASLVSQGAVYTLDESVGKRAMVYQTVPEKGRGVIQLYLNGLTRDIPAVSETGQKIPSFMDVEVIRVVDGRTVSVKPIA